MTTDFFLSLPLKYWQDFQDAISKATDSNVYLIDGAGIPFSKFSQDISPCVKINEGKRIQNKTCLDFYKNTVSSVTSPEVVICPFKIRVQVFPLFAPVQKIGTLLVTPLDMNIFKNKELKAAFIAKTKNIYHTATEVIKATIEKNLLGSQSLVLNSLHQITRLFISTIALDKVIDLIINSLIIIFDTQMVFLVLRDGRNIKLVKAKGENITNLKDKVIPPENPLMKKISSETEPVCLSVDEFKNLFDLDEVNLESEANVWIYPLWGSLGMIGMLGVVFSKNEYKTINTVNLYANITAIALTNAVLIKDLEIKTEIDPLTGLYNKKAIMDILKREFELGLRNNSVLSVIIIDIDDFKSYNDTFGHLAGDVVIQKVGEIIKKSIRKIDFGGRFGGDEFVIILPETGEEGARKVIERIKKALQAATFPNQQITLSFGVATSESNDTPQKILAKADKNLYKAKNQGKNKAVF